MFNRLFFLTLSAVSKRATLRDFRRDGRPCATFAVNTAQQLPQAISLTESLIIEGALHYDPGYVHLLPAPVVTLEFKKIVSVILGGLL